MYNGQILETIIVGIILLFIAIYKYTKNEEENEEECVSEKQKDMRKERHLEDWKNRFSDFRGRFGLDLLYNYNSDKYEDIISIANLKLHRFRKEYYNIFDYEKSSNQRKLAIENSFLEYEKLFNWHIEHNEKFMLDYQNKKYEEENMDFLREKINESPFLNEIMYIEKLLTKQ